MELKDIVCDAKYAKQLKELGVLQTSFACFSVIKRDGKGNPIEILYYGSASEISKYKQGRGNFDTPEGRKVLLTYGGDTYVALARMITGIQSGISYAGVRRDSEAIANIFGLKTLSRWMRQSPAGFLEGSKT